MVITSHAIKNEFEYDIKTSGPERFRAHYSAKGDGCRWRIHA
jgi:hypothetical protein